MAIKNNPVKQLACKIVNLQAPTHNSDDEQEESRFFADDEPQPTKPAWLQKAGVEVKNIKYRLERNQREAKILAKLSHVRPYPLATLHGKVSEQLRSQISSPSRRSFGRPIRCGSELF